MKNLLTIIFLLPAFLVSGQTLIPDAGFEEYKYCPVTFNQGQDSYFKYWKQPNTGTSDYFNACSRIVGTPKNEFGYQKPHSGNGYAGLITFSPSLRNYREYLSVRLETPLVAGKKYCLSAFVSLADNAAFMSDGLGFAVSKDEIKSKNDKLLILKPVIENPKGHILRDDNNWWELSGSYTAIGGENYLIFGNFSDDKEISVNHRKVEPKNGQIWEHAYYFVDDINVIAIDEKNTCNCTIDYIKQIMINPGLKDEQFSEVETRSILFDFDKFDINEKADNQLKNVVRLLSGNSYLHLEIDGHTDVVGPEMYNDSLSAKRAKVVLKYLENHGVEPTRLRIKYFGSKKPMATNATAEGRSKNRRVEFSILKINYEDYEVY